MRVESPLKVAVGGEAFTLAKERLDLENENESLALENARLANENMVLQNERLAQENAALRMQQPSMNAMQGAMMPPHMNPMQQWWGGTPWGMPPAACNSLGYGGGLTPEADVMSSRANELSRKASELRAKAKGLKDATVSAMPGKKKTSSVQRNQKKCDGEGSFPLASFGSSSTAYGPGSLALNSLASTTSESSAALAESEAADTLLAMAQAEALPLHLRTTVMMRNIPNNYTREMLTELVNDEGFKGNYDLVYLPIDFQSKVTNLGYSFINFADAEVATRFQSHFSGFCKWTLESDKVCEVTWSDAIQGIDAHIERYRNSPVMHESVPDECKPVLFKEGERTTFPEPTKKIRAPRQWQRQGCSSQNR